MEVEAVTDAVHWLASQRDTKITHALILTDSLYLMQGVEPEMGCGHTQSSAARTTVDTTALAMSESEGIHRLASTADNMTTYLQLSKALRTTRGTF